MKYVLIIYEVEDYVAWKKIFDQAAGIRKEAGEISNTKKSKSNSTFLRLDFLRKSQTIFRITQAGAN